MKLPGNFVFQLLRPPFPAAGPSDRWSGWARASACLGGKLVGVPGSGAVAL